MVSIIKLKELGFNVDNLPNKKSHACDHLVHHVLRGYKKFGETYAHALADHSEHIFGIENKESFRQDLLEKIHNKEKDDVLHCALSIMSIHHGKNHHGENGRGHAYHEAHRVLVSFLKKSPEKISELHERFPHITPEVLAAVIPSDILEEKIPA